MPTYQYACTECGHAFEQVQSFSDDALTVCPVCSGRLRKVFNAVGVVFKGSGFYRTDSRSGTSSTLAPGTSEKSSGDSVVERLEHHDRLRARTPPRPRPPAPRPAPSSGSSSSGSGTS